MDNIYGKPECASPVYHQNVENFSSLENIKTNKTLGLVAETLVSSEALTLTDHMLLLENVQLE